MTTRVKTKERAKNLLEELQHIRKNYHLVEHDEELADQYNLKIQEAVELLLRHLVMEA